MFEAPMPPPANPPAIVRRWCDANGCYVVRGFVNPPATVPTEAPMPMPQAHAPMPAPRLKAFAEAVARPFRNFFIFAKTHRPRLLWR